jgi:hypothetical protein
MKDLPHHIKKLNRRVIRSMHREEMEELPDIPARPDTAREKKKKAKQKMKADTLNRTPTHKTADQRNKEMRTGRVPVFERNNAKPKHARSTKKKTPRI